MFFGCGQSPPGSESVLFVSPLYSPFTPLWLCTLLLSRVCRCHIRENIRVPFPAWTTDSGICLPFRKVGIWSGSTSPLFLIFPHTFSLQTRGEMRKNHRLVSWLWKLRTKESERGSMIFTDHLPLLGRKLASSTSSMQSSCAWRRRPLSICSGASTCPTRMPGSAWAALALRVTPTPSRSANSLVPL